MRRRVVPLERGFVAYHSPVTLGHSPQPRWQGWCFSFTTGFLAALALIVWILWPYVD